MFSSCTPGELSSALTRFIMAGTLGTVAQESAALFSFLLHLLCHCFSTSAPSLCMDAMEVIQ